MVTEITGYRLLVPDEIAGFVRKLHPVIKAQIKAGMKLLIYDPYRGKALKEELSGLRSFRVKRFRIIYRVDASRKLLEIVTIGPRNTIYQETFRIVSKG